MQTLKVIIEGGDGDSAICLPDARFQGLAVDVGVGTDRKRSEPQQKAMAALRATSEVV